MKRTLLTLIAALLLGGAAIAQNHWDAPDSHAKSGNTPIVAAVTVDNAAPTGAELAVFVGEGENEELRGLATTTLDGKYWVQAFYNSGSTETLTFKLWNPADGGAELDTYTLTYTYTDSNNQTVTLDALTTCEEGYGTPSNPVQIAFTATQAQTMQLASGWTWWSTYVEMDGVNGLGMLEESLGVNGRTIKSRTKTAQYQPALNRWYGNLTSLNNEEGYRVQTAAACPYSVSGSIANPEDHPISIQPNWTWIGYPVSYQQTVTQALEGFEPQVNDIIKSHGSSARYLPNGWYPSTFTLNPGESYMYYSKATTNKTLVFANNRNSNNGFLTEIDDRYWQNNIHDFADNLTLLCVVNIDGEEQRDENLELGVFVNGNCRGSSKLMYVEPLDRYYAIMNVLGQDGDLVEFAIVNRKTDVINRMTTDHFVFTSNAIIGEFDSPYVVNFGSAFSLNENMGSLGIYPNPINRNESFNLLVPEDEIVIDLTITNALGEFLCHETGEFSKHYVNGISVSGVYLIRVVCKSGNIYQGRLIVK